MMSYRKLQFWVVTLILLLSVSPVFAQVRPEMSVYINWTPDQSLTSFDIDGPDEDLHYVDAEFYIDGNVQFWAAEIQCNIGRGTELSFAGASDLTFSDLWGVADNDYVVIGTGNPAIAGDFYNPVGGVFGFTVSRIGASSLPIGVNGRDFTSLLATARFQVNDLPSNARVGALCRVMNFLDRDGNLAVRGRQTRINDLNVYVGYTLTGSALRQGTNNHANIEVSCIHDPNGTPSAPEVAMTDLRGNFRFGGAVLQTQPNVLRSYGLYRCDFTSKSDTINEDEAILVGQTYFNLSSPSMSLLPVLLDGGDVDFNETIEFADVVAVTSNFNTLSSTGDANLDNRVDATDLAITTGNLGYAEPSRADHVIFSMGRDYNDREIFPNSKIWWGTPDSGQVYELVTRSRTRDFWATLSPDGSEVVYVSVDIRTGQHLLAFGTVANGRGLSIRAPRGFTDHMLAPSWSPDGNRIAFICTPDDVANNAGMQYNEGDICIFNRDDRILSTLFSLDVDARIFPPAWIPYGADDNDYLIVYGGTDGRIHYYDLANETQGIVPIDNGGSDVVDMPVFQRNILDGSNTLVYRFNASGSSDPYLKVGTIAYDGTTFTGGVTGAVNGSTHVALNGTADTTGVDFFDVSPQGDIIFYHSYLYSVANSVPLNTYYTIHAGYASAPVERFPDGWIGNPVTETLNGGVWSGSYNVPTMLHAQRATFDWVP